MTQSIMPVRRNLEFHLPEDRISDWKDGNVHISHFMNAMSIFFPVGERFFIDSVRHFRGVVDDDPQLKEAVKGFIGQEAMHGREHEEYNAALQKKGLPAEAYEAVVVKTLAVTNRITPKAAQLGATIALEHITAILADGLLRNPASLTGAEPRYSALWRWHAMEETEHKAVAFDVFARLHRKSPVISYFRRCFALLISTLMFFSMVFIFHIGLVRREPGQLWNLKGWGSLIAYLWGPRGVLLRMIPGWLAFFKPGFHPWDHDNAHYLEGLDALSDEVESYAAA